MCALNLGACSNPASETAVSLQPGRYATSIDGAFKSEMADSEICFSESDDDGNIVKLVRKQFALYESCTHQAAARVGNAIGGTLTCKIDATAGHDTVYKGSLTAELLTIDATSTSYAPALGSTAGEIEEISVAIPLRARRIGNCS